MVYSQSLPHVRPKMPFECAPPPTSGFLLVPLGFPTRQTLVGFWGLDLKESGEPTSRSGYKFGPAPQLPDFEGFLVEQQVLVSPFSRAGGHQGGAVLRGGSLAFQARRLHPCQASQQGAKSARAKLWGMWNGRQMDLGIYVAVLERFFSQLCKMGLNDADPLFLQRGGQPSERGYPET